MNKSTVQAQLGMSIRELRIAKSMSQEDLAQACNLHRTYIGSVERGERNISLNNIVVVSEVLGISASELLRHAGL